MKKIKISPCDYELVYLSDKDKRLKKLIQTIGEIECNVHQDGFSFIVEQIVGQMLSNKAAFAINDRLYELCDGNITPYKLNELSFEEIKSIGVSKQKADYIKKFADIFLAHEVDLTALNDLDDETVIKKLTSIRGIGNWTAKMYLLFALRRPDILPFEDVAFLQSYKWLYNTELIDKESIYKKCKKWKPYSSYAARYLYRALDLGLTKDKFHLYR